MITLRLGGECRGKILKIEYGFEEKYHWGKRLHVIPTTTISWKLRSAEKIVKTRIFNNVPNT